MRTSSIQKDSVKRLSGIGSREAYNLKTPQPCRMVERNSQQLGSRCILERYTSGLETPETRHFSSTRDETSRIVHSSSLSDRQHKAQEYLSSCLANEKLHETTVFKPSSQNVKLNVVNGVGSHNYTSPRCHGSYRRVTSCGPQLPKEGATKMQICTPLKPLKTRFGGTLNGESSDAFSSVSRVTATTANSSATAFSKSSSKLSGTSAHERSGTTFSTASSCRSASASRHYRRYSSLVQKHEYKDQITSFPTTFENISLDPSKFSSEKVRRDAGLVILRCLHMKKYPQQLLLQDFVHCPSTQQYINLMQFLFNQIAPSAEPFILEEKVTSMFKMLGYPLQFAKSHFRSPCTPLMWPHHLASIAWLCALLIFDETILCDLARPPIMNSPSELPSTTSNTPRVIGGFRCFTDEEKIPKESYDFYSKSVSNKSPRSFLHRPNEELATTLDFVPNEPITVALVRTIQTAYMLYIKQGKEVNEQNLSRLLEVDLAKYRAKEEAALKEVLVLRDVEKEAYRIEKAKLDEIGTLQVQAGQQTTDCLRFEQRIQTTEKLIEDKKRHIEVLKAETARQSVYILELQQQVNEVSERLVVQGISKTEVEEYVEKTQQHRKILAELQEDIKQAESEYANFQKRVQQTADNVEQSTKTCSKLMRSLATSLYEFDGTQSKNFIENFPFSLTFSMTPLSDSRVKKPVVSEYTLEELEQLSTRNWRSQQLSHLPEANEKLLEDLEELFQESFRNVSWSSWVDALERVIEKQYNILNNIKKKIKSSTKIHVTLENSIQLKTKKTDVALGEIGKMKKVLENKNAIYQTLLNELEDSAKKSGKTFLNIEIQELKQRGIELQKEFSKAHEKKLLAMKRLEEIEKRATEKLLTWLKAAKEEIGIVLSKLTRAKDVVVQETHEINGLLKSMSNLHKDCVIPSLEDFEHKVTDSMDSKNLHTVSR